MFCVPVFPPAIDTSSAVMSPTGAFNKPFPVLLLTVNLSLAFGQDSVGDILEPAYAQNLVYPYNVGWFPYPSLV